MFTGVWFFGVMVLMLNSGSLWLGFRNLWLWGDAMGCGGRTMLPEIGSASMVPPGAVTLKLLKEVLEVEGRDASCSTVDSHLPGGDQDQFEIGGFKILSKRFALEGELTQSLSVHVEPAKSELSKL